MSRSDERQTGAATAETCVCCAAIRRTIQGHDLTHLGLALGAPVHVLVERLCRAAERRSAEVTPGTLYVITRTASARYMGVYEWVRAVEHAIHFVSLDAAKAVAEVARKANFGVEVQERRRNDAPTWDDAVREIEGTRDRFARLGWLEDVATTERVLCALALCRRERAKPTREEAIAWAKAGEPAPEGPLAGTAPNAGEASKGGG